MSVRGFKSEDPPLRETKAQGWGTRKMPAVQNRLRSTSQPLLLDFESQNYPGNSETTPKIRIEAVVNAAVRVLAGQLLGRRGGY